MTDLSASALQTPVTEGTFLVWSESVDSFLAEIAKASARPHRQALPAAQPGMIIAQRYRLTRPIGRGAYGTVWVAHDAISEAEVAIKLLGVGSADESSMVRAEIASLRRVRVAGTLMLLDEGVEGDFVFIVMPLLSGVPFPALSAPARWEQLEGVTMRLLETLAQVHAQGIVHRDLKPANVLVNERGVPIVLDFGLSVPAFVAGGEDSLQVAGTPAYLAPEQVDSLAAVDHRADLYAVGVMLYRSLSGRFPHEEVQTRALLAAKFHAPPSLRLVAPDVPVTFATVIDALLERQPGDRPSSATEVLRMLREPRATQRDDAVWPIRIAPSASRSLSVEEVAELFVSGDGLGWIPEDAALLLVRETDGDPARLRARLREWLDDRSCRWAKGPGSRLAIDRSTLDRLEARMRFPKLRETGDLGRIVATARALASEDGRLGIAFAVVQDAIAEVRKRSQKTEHDLELLFSLLVQIALTDGSPEIVDRVLYELCRIGPVSTHLRRLENLVRAGLAIGPWTERALELASSLTPFEDPSLEVWRLSIRLLASRRTSIEKEQAVLEELEAWASGMSDPAAKGRFAGWLGRLRYRQGRFAEAAILHQEAAAAPLWRTQLAAAMTDAASALMEAFRLDEALVLAAEAERIFAQCRQARGFVLASWFTRTIGYRQGTTQPPEPERVEAPASLGLRELEGLFCVTEAAIAWRVRDLETAAALAARGEATWSAMGERAGALLLCAALHVASRPEAAIPEERIDQLARRAWACPTPGVGIQVLALLAHHRSPPRDEGVEAELAGQVPREHWARRIDVLSVEEALACLAAR